MAYNNKNIKEMILESEIIENSDVIIIPFLRYFRITEKSQHRERQGYLFDCDKINQLLNVINKHFEKFDFNIFNTV